MDSLNTKTIYASNIKNMEDLYIIYKNIGWVKSGDYITNAINNNMTIKLNLIYENPDLLISNPDSLSWHSHTGPELLVDGNGTEIYYTKIDSEIIWHHSLRYENNLLKSYRRHFYEFKSGLPKMDIVFYNNTQVDNIKKFIIDKDGNPQSHGDQISYYKNGQIAAQGFSINGKAHGKQINYYEDGQIHQIEHYLNGTPNEEHISYRQDGTIFDKLRYSNGKLDFHNRYDSKGKIIRQDLYDKGKWILWRDSMGKEHDHSDL